MKGKSVIAGVVVVVIALVLLLPALPISWFGETRGSLFAKPTPADTVIHNGSILTSNDRRPYARALAIRDGKIVYIGSDNGKALSFVGTGTRVIDAKKSLVTPGFVDAHTHALWLGILSPVMTFIYDAGSLEDVARLVRSYGEQNPDLPFIFAIGWKYDYIPNGIPTLRMADDILRDRPLILWSHDGHTGWVNSLALQQMQERNPKAFEYLTPDFDKDHKPTGIFRHFYTINPMDFYTVEEMGGEAIVRKMAQGVAAKLEEGLRVGVTCHHDVMIHRSTFDLLLKLKKRGVFRDARVRASHFVNHHLYEDDPATLFLNLASWKRLAGSSTDHFVIGESIKLGIDGVSPNHTALLYKPYKDDKTTKGVASYTAEGFNRLVTLIDSMRLQICTHGVGDAGITRIIDGYEFARKVNGAWDSRHTIEHNSMIVDKDVPRLARLGIHASMQPTHYFGDRATVKALGKRRFLHAHRFGTLQRAKVRLAFGTDYSIVPMNPIYGTIVAVTRLSCLGPPRTMDEFKEMLSFEDVIRHYTLGSAAALHMDRLIGSLEVGKRADLVIFSIDRNEFSRMCNLGIMPPSDILDQLVSMTFVDGRVVYQRP
ncbi:MAG TPA: amidohydrolase [Syntrophobacteraceae bacterium]|nr:amidohydrolase [Syntrophobacteraceae bacterium]